MRNKVFPIAQNSFSESGSYIEIISIFAPINKVLLCIGHSNLPALEEEGEIYETIEDIWPDYPTKDDFFFNEEEY